MAALSSVVLNSSIMPTAEGLNHLRRQNAESVMNFLRKGCKQIGLHSSSLMLLERRDAMLSTQATTLLSHVRGASQPTGSAANLLAQDRKPVL